MSDLELKQSRVACEFCNQIVNAIDLELTQVPLSYAKLWACDECRRIAKETQQRVVELMGEDVGNDQNNL